MKKSIEDYLKIAAELYKFDTNSKDSLATIVRQYADDELSPEELEDVSAAADYFTFIKNIKKEN